MDGDDALWSFWSGLGSSNKQSQVPVAAPSKVIEPTAVMTLDELVADYNINVRNNNWGEPFVIAEPKQQYAVTSDMSLWGEVGTTSPSPWTSFTRQEYNQDLVGLKGLEQYDKMRRSDGTARGTLRLVKSPVLAGRFYVEAGGKSRVDETAREFIEKCLFEEMSTPWMQTLTEALLMLDFGYYMFEKVFEPRIIDNTPRIVWKKMAPRHPMDVKQWHFDANGGPRYVEMYKPYTPTYGGYEGDSISIPIEKLLVFTFDKEAGNIEGISVLRSAYKHWYYKDQLYKIDAIQKERHGIGIPIIKLPQGYKEEDKVIAENLGRNIRTNERAHIVLPPMWDVVMLKLEGNLVDCLESAKHHDDLIRENVLGEFIRGQANEEIVSMFLKATKFIADIVAETFNNYAIPQLFDMNFSRGKCPKLCVRRIGETGAWRELSFAIRNLVGAGILRPDDKLEEFAREELELPDADSDTARITATPQNPNQGAAGTSSSTSPAGPPKQSTANNMKQAQNAGGGVVGRDAGGR